MGRKTIYPIDCDCCDPPVLLSDSNARQNHRRQMSKKRSAASAVESDSDNEARPAPINRAAVKIFSILLN